MAFVVDQVTFTLDTGTGNQTVPLSLFASETPKAVLFLTSGRAAAGHSAGIAQNALGFATSAANQYCIARASDDGVDLTATTTNARRYRVNSRCLTTVNPASTANLDSFEFVGFGSNNFEIDIINNSNAGTQITAVVFGGADLTNVVAANWAPPTSTGTDPNTPTLIGWQPDCAIVCTTGQNANGNTTNSTFNLSLWDSALNTFNIAVTGRDNRSGAQGSDERYHNSDEAIEHRSFSGAGTAQGIATLDSWAPAGFNLTYTDAFLSGRQMYGLFFQGVENLAARELSPATATNVDTVLGFTPKFVFYAGNSTATWPITSTNGNSPLSLGVSDGTAQIAHGANSLDAQATTQQSRATLDTDDSLVHYAPDMSVAEQARAVFNGQTLETTFSQADSTPRHFMLLALGEAGGPVTLNPSATGTFSGRTSGDVTRDIPPTLNPSATGTFSGRTTGNVLAVLQPSATGSFSGRTSGNVTRAGLLNPSATGSFSGRTSGDVVTVGKVNPSAAGSFSGATSGDVLAALRPSATGIFSGRTSGSVTIPPKAAVCRRVAAVPKENRTAKV